MKPQLKFLTAILAFGVASQLFAAAPKTMLRVRVLDSSGTKQECLMAQDGSRLYVVGAAGIEIFECVGSVTVIDLSSKSVRVLRAADGFVVLHAGGILQFKKASAES